MTDHELLKDYARGGSEAAFAELVRRYADLVYQSARRQTFDAHLAEDVTQAVFLLLARRAARIGERVVVAGWLLNATRYAAAGAMRSEFRRRRREREAARMRNGTVEASCEELREVLDEGLAQLKEQERGLVALRHLEGMRVEQVAEVVGIGPEAARRRIGRAVAKLRRYLARRGYSVESAEALEGAIEGVAARGERVPETFAAALPLAVLGAGGGLAGPQEIAGRAMREMGRARLKVGSAFVVAALGVGGIGLAVAGGAAPDRVASPRRTVAADTTPAVVSAAAAPGRPQVGRFQLRFTEMSPNSLREDMGERNPVSSMGTYGRRGRTYDIANETFEVYVPAGYRADRPYGLMVWIGAGEATLPDDWRRALDRTRTIWVSANNTGNGRDAVERVGLAVDAAYNMQRRYGIDPQRVYVSGFSGGGLVAETIIKAYPDVFTGAFCMAGGTFYLHAGDEVRLLPTVDYLAGELSVDEARRALRLVMLSGEKDGFGRSARADAEGFRLDDFEHVTYFEVPGLGHSVPTGAWVEKGILALDRARTSPTTHPATKPAWKKGMVRPPRTNRNVTRALPAHDPEAQAARLLNSGRIEACNGWPEVARLAAERVLREYPSTPAAGEARVMLEQIEAIADVAMPYGSLNTSSKTALFHGRSNVYARRLDVARLYFERVVVLKPNSAEAREAAAWVEWVDAHPAAAMREKTAPAVLGTVLFQSGLHYSGENLRGHAEAAYRKVLAEYPGTPAADAARKMLAQGK